jgi:Mg2+/citrate symporter
MIHLILSNPVSAFFCGLIFLTIVLAFIPGHKIKLIGDFYKKVMPTIPFTGILKLWRREGDDK